MASAPAAAAAPGDETLSMEVHDALYQVKHDKEGVRIICNMIAEATGCPEWGQACYRKISSGLVPIEMVNLWNQNIITMDNYKDQFMLWGYDLYQKEVYLTTPEEKTIANPTQINELLSSGKNDWDYEPNRESGNIEPLRSCFYEMQDDVAINVHSLFAGIGFDKKLFEQKGEWGLCLHVQTGVNNRFIDVGTIYSSDNDANYDSIWHYMTHYGVDMKEINDRLTNTDAICLLTKRVHKDSLTCKPKYHNILAPFSDMWNKATGHTMDCSDLYTDESIIGGPHAVPAKFSDVKKLFHFFTNKKFDDLYDIGLTNENRADWNDDRKAVFCFSALLRLFHDPSSSFYVSSHAGMYNLYCFFLQKEIPKDVVDRIYKRAEVLLSSDNPEDVLQGVHILNLLFPNTIEELQLRVRYFWNKYVPIQLHPLEGQKRKITNIYNLLGLKPSTYPIKSFFLLSDLQRAPPRTNLNRRPRGKLEQKEFESSDKQYFFRTKVPIKTTFLGFKSSAPGLTIKQASIFRDISTMYASHNTDVQLKLCNEHLRDMFMTMLDNTDVYAMNIDYTPSELAQNKQLYDRMEKHVKSQIVFMRRLFYEKFREKCYSNEGLLAHWMVAWQKRLEEVLEPTKKGVDTIWVRTKDPKKGSKEGKKPRAVIMGACLDFMDKFKDDWFELQLNKESFVCPRSDDIFLYPAQAFNPDKLNDLDFKKNWNKPDKIEYWLGIWCMNVKEGTGIGSMAHFIPKNPDPTVILSVLFSHSVFSKPSFKNLINFFQNNGQKSLKYPPAEYILDQNGPKPLREYRPIKFFWANLNEGCWIKMLTLCVLEPAYTLAKIFALETQLAYMDLVYLKDNCLAKDHVSQRIISCLCRDLVKSLALNGRFLPIDPAMEDVAPFLYALLTQGSTVEIGPDEDCVIKGFLFKNDLTVTGGTNHPLLLSLIELMLLHDNTFLSRGLEEREGGKDAKKDKIEKLLQSLKAKEHKFRKNKIAGKTFFNVYISSRTKLLQLEEKKAKKNHIWRRGQYWQKSTKNGQKVGEYLDEDWEKSEILFEIIERDGGAEVNETQKGKKNKKSSKPRDTFKIYELCQVISTGGCRNPDEAKILQEFRFAQQSDPNLQPTREQKKILERVELAHDLWERMERELSVLDYSDKDQNPDTRAMVIALLKALRRQADISSLLKKEKKSKKVGDDEDEEEDEEEEEGGDDEEEEGYDLVVDSKLRNKVKNGKEDMSTIGCQYFAMGARVMFHEAADSVDENQLAYNTKEHFSKILGQKKEGLLYDNIGKTLYTNSLTAVKTYVKAKLTSLSSDKKHPLQPDQVDKFFTKVARNTNQNQTLLGLNEWSESSSNKASTALLKDKEVQLVTAKSESDKFKRLARQERKLSFESLRSAAKNAYYSMKLTAYLNSPERHSVEFGKWKPEETGRNILELQLIHNPHLLEDEYSWYPKWVTEHGKRACDHVAAKQIETLRKFARLEEEDENWYEYLEILKDTTYGAFSERVVARLLHLRNVSGGLPDGMISLLDQMADAFKNNKGHGKKQEIIISIFQDYEDELRKTLVLNAYVSPPDPVPKWFMQPMNHFTNATAAIPKETTRQNLLASIVSDSQTYFKNLSASVRTRDTPSPNGGLNSDGKKRGRNSPQQEGNKKSKTADSDSSSDEDDDDDDEDEEEDDEEDEEKSEDKGSDEDDDDKSGQERSHPFGGDDGDKSGQDPVRPFGNMSDNDDIAKDDGEPNHGGFESDFDGSGSQPLGTQPEGPPLQDSDQTTWDKNRPENFTGKRPAPSSPSEDNRPKKRDRKEEPSSADHEEENDSPNSKARTDSKTKTKKTPVTKNSAKSPAAKKKPEGGKVVDRTPERKRRGSQKRDSDSSYTGTSKSSGGRSSARKSKPTQKALELAEEKKRAEEEKRRKMEEKREKRTEQARKRAEQSAEKRRQQEEKKQQQVAKTAAQRQKELDKKKTGGPGKKKNPFGPSQNSTLDQDLLS